MYDIGSKINNCFPVPDPIKSGVGRYVDKIFYFLGNFFFGTCK